jgi:hypothetical protein
MGWILGPAAGWLVVGAAVALPAVAAADPPLDDPIVPVADTAGAHPPPEQPPGVTLGPLGSLTGNGLELLLGQYPAPSAPGTQAVTLPNADVLNAGQFLNPTNYRLSPYVLAPGEPGPFARVDGLKGLHAILHGALGRMPAAQLSEPLPGTAPPPGTNIPIGPVQNLPDPAVAHAVPPGGSADAPQPVSVLQPPLPVSVLQPPSPTSAG